MERSHSVQKWHCWFSSTWSCNYDKIDIGFHHSCRKSAAKHSTCGVKSKSQTFFWFKPWVPVCYHRIVQTCWPKSSSEIWPNNSKPTPTSFRGFFRWHLPLGCCLYNPQRDTREMRFPKHCEGRRSKNTNFAHQFFDFMPNNVCSSITKRDVNGPEDRACTQKKTVSLMF